MILTGPEIEKEMLNGNIVIDPFTSGQLNPNSYNFCLGRSFKVYEDFPLDPKVMNKCKDIVLPDDGYVLSPRKLYLGCTVEVLGSKSYAPTFAARSSVARLGLFINLSACLGDIGYVGRWTLQLYSIHPLRVYPGMAIGQMMWWKPEGEIVQYKGKYQNSMEPRDTLSYIDYEKRHIFPKWQSADSEPVIPT